MTLNHYFNMEDGRLTGLKIIHPFYMEDERGFFLKSFEQDIFKELGLSNIISEDFESFSLKGVIRGMHFQIHKPQIKMVRAIFGEIQDIVVDLRQESPTFGQWENRILSDRNHDIFYIPAGFAHGFEVLSEKAIVSYKCIGKYDRETDTGIRWDDKELKLPWKTGTPIVSDKDSRLMCFEQYKHMYVWGGG